MHDRTLLRHVTSGGGGRGGPAQAQAADAWTNPERGGFRLRCAFARGPAERISDQLLSVLRKGNFQNDMECGEEKVNAASSIHPGVLRPGAIGLPASSGGCGRQVKVVAGYPSGGNAASQEGRGQGENDHSFIDTLSNGGFFGLAGDCLGLRRHAGIFPRLHPSASPGGRAGPGAHSPSHG